MSLRASKLDEVRVCKEGHDLMMMDLGNTIAGELESSLLTHDSASLAVPGGTTPGPIFDVLCAAHHTG